MLLRIKGVQLRETSANTMHLSGDMSVRSRFVVRGKTQGFVWQPSSAPTGLESGTCSRGTSDLGGGRLQKCSLSVCSKLENKMNRNPNPHCSFISHICYEVEAREDFHCWLHKQDTDRCPGGRIPVAVLLLAGSVTLRGGLIFLGLSLHTSKMKVLGWELWFSPGRWRNGPLGKGRAGAGKLKIPLRCFPSIAFTLFGNSLPTTHNFPHPR